MKNSKFYLIVWLVLGLNFNTNAQKKKITKNHKSIISPAVNGLKFRSIGPAFSSGRIADFAVNPDNPAEYYVATAAGHVWKTTNNGISFKPVFDHYGVYSMGCIAMAPQNHHIIWLGTGENNHQRDLGYGNGVYKSVDGGASWQNMGLKSSQHIGMINIDPRDKNTVLVAAEGSIWGPGGDRGLYKTTDEGKTWKKVLNISENTGVNNIIRDPKNPDILYATSEQRRRHENTHISGGPESKVYKSEDNGQTWRKIMKGLPQVDLGGMGIAVSPVNSDVVYLVVEAAEGKSGFFRSTDQGESWHKMSNYHSSGQYYNEIYCDPKNVDKVYAPQTYTRYTEDGGKTWHKLGLKNKHVDDHAIWIDPNHTNHFLIGGDGGVYVSYDGGKTYRHASNLPVVQFYTVYLDNASPFYNVYGGTQDNNSYGGPSRSIRAEGINKSDWTVTVGGDGFWGAVDPANPDIVYSEYQYGNLYRFDKKSGQRLKIKPIPAKDELTYRWNWSAPFIISPHNHKRLYLAAERLFRSDDRGNSWQTVSPDLTAHLDRDKWPVMGKYWSVDAVRKDVSTSLYGTLVAVDESPVKEGLLYTGSNDGVIQISRDGGQNWFKKETFPNVPQYTFVSDIFADRFDQNTVYAAFDNRKRNDFKPYLLKSTDQGHSWHSIVGNLPKDKAIHSISQDTQNKNLLFVGTELGIYFTLDGGQNWIRLKSGIPDVAVKDIAIQKRENDLVVATFGRGIYILDDYSPLRQLSKAFLQRNKAYLFPVKDALQYIKTHKKYGQGETDFYAKNPPFGAIFTYYLKDVPLSTTAARRKEEKDLFKKGEKMPHHTWKALYDEKLEEPSYLLFTISDTMGHIIDKITAKPQKGIHRVAWQLTYDNPFPVDKDLSQFKPFEKQNFGIPVLPGTYQVRLDLYDKGQLKPLSGAVTFKVNRLNNTSLPPAENKDYQTYFTDLQQTLKKLYKIGNQVATLKKDLILMKQTALKTAKANQKIMLEIQNAEKQVNQLIFILKGVKPKASYEEIPPHKLPLNERFSKLAWAHINSTAPITKTEKTQLKIVKESVQDISPKVNQLKNGLVKTIAQQLDQIGAPWTPGR